MGLEALLEKLEARRSDTPDTPCNLTGVSRETASLLACTRDTLDTPQTCKVEEQISGDLLELERDGGLRRGTVSAAAEHTPRRWWRIRRQDGQEVSVYCSPMASLAEMRERHPDALSLEPYEPERRPGRPLTTAEEVAIRAWLVSIGETDPGSVAAVLAQCAQDAESREYYLARGREARCRGN